MAFRFSRDQRGLPGEFGVHIPTEAVDGPARRPLSACLVEFSTRTLCNAVQSSNKAMEDPKTWARVGGLLKLARNRGWLPIDERDASRVIEQIVHLKISRRGGDGRLRRLDP